MMRRPYIPGKKLKKAFALTSLFCALLLSPPVVNAQSISELRNQANEAFFAGEYERLEQIARQTIDQSLNSEEKKLSLVWGYRTLGLALRIQRDLDNSEDAYRKALAIRPNRPDSQSLNGLGNIYFERELWAEAIQKYQEAIDADYLNFYPHRNKALAFVELNQFDNAIAAYRDAIDIDPSDPLTYIWLAEAQTLKSDWEGAIETYQTFISKAKTESSFKSWNLSSIYSGLGYAFQQNNQLPEAREAYREALKISSNNTAAETNLRRINQQLALPESTDEELFREEITPPPEDIRNNGRVKNSVVEVICVTQVSTCDGQLRGAGWVIKRNPQKAWIVTNRHVLTKNDTPYQSGRDIDNEILEGGIGRPDDEYITAEVKFYNSNEEDRISLPAKRLYSTDADSLLDLAILEVNNPPEYAQPLEISSIPAKPRDEKISVSGHTIGKSWHLLNAEITSDEMGELTIDAFVKEGFSGGPVLNSKDQVVGIIHRIDISSAEPGTRLGYALAHPIEQCLNLLKEWGVY